MTDGASIYILLCSDGGYYTGITRRPVERVSEHANGVVPGCFPFSRRPVMPAYCEHYDRIDEAVAAERRIKGWSRAKKKACAAISNGYANSPNGGASQLPMCRVGFSPPFSAHGQEPSSRTGPWPIWVSGHGGRGWAEAHPLPLRAEAPEGASKDVPAGAAPCAKAPVPRSPAWTPGRARRGRRPAFRRGARMAEGGGDGLSLAPSANRTMTLAGGEQTHMGLRTLLTLNCGQYFPNRLMKDKTLFQQWIRSSTERPNLSFLAGFFN